MRRRHTYPAWRRSYWHSATPSGAHPFAFARSSARLLWLRARAAQARREWGQRRMIRRRWRGAPLSGGLALCAVVVACAGLLAAAPTTVGTAAAAGGTPFAGTTNAPQVSVAIDLHDSQLHPQQLAYDTGRDSLWFWTSQRQAADGAVDNRVYQYELKSRQLRSWPLSGGDWSTQVLAGLAVAPDGAVWIGWNHQLVVFHPADGSSTLYALPAQPRYPLPSAIMHDLPADLGIADLAVAHDGTVWLARAGALSLTRFDPPTQTFTEVPLPTTAGDPAKLAVGPEGHLFFTVDFSADQPGALFARIGEYDPQTSTTWVYQQPAEALALTASGDLYTTAGGPGLGLARLSASERATAHTQGRAPVFTRRVVPFDTDGTALATDAGGRVWLAVEGQPAMAVLDPKSGQVRQYQYAAPSMAAYPAHPYPGMRPTTPAPGAVWLTHIATMVTDGQGHLWYVRMGRDQIETVAA